MVGGVWAYYIGFIYPQFAVDPLVTIGDVLMTFLGGRGTLWGPVLGAFILVPAQQYLAYRARRERSSTWSRYAACSWSIMLLLPRGILPVARATGCAAGARGRRSRRRRRRGAAARGAGGARERRCSRSMA